MENTPIVFLIMISVAVFLLVWNLMVPVFGAERKAAKLLKRRLRRIATQEHRSSAAQMLRDKYLRNLSPIERKLETLPGMDRLALLLEQSGRKMPAHRLLLLSISMGIAGGALAWYSTNNYLVGIVAGALLAAIPFLKINLDRSKRLARFEEQLPEAMDIMVRALKAGHPFSGTLKLVAEEMDQPISTEFGIVFADINYGLEVKQAFLNLLERVPNMTLMTVVTAVIVQKETGGNLAETLANISAIVRSRFRFQRKVRSMSAEGRMSAWVLVLIPFVLFVGLMVTSPNYLTDLITEPEGIKLLSIAFTMVIIGIFWLRRIIRIDV
ncbi:MAG: secretion system protein [Actinobacteria bacterium]|nr:MAG: secretion system protein [Actinomycetota bacterium]